MRRAVRLLRFGRERSRPRRRVEVGRLRVPAMAVPVATTHADNLPGRAPDAHAAAPRRRGPSEMQPKNSG